MQFKSNRPLPKPETEFDKVLSDVFFRMGRQLEDILNAGVKFSDNFDAYLTTFTSDGTPNTEFAVAHTLKRIPVGRVVLYQTKAGSLYQGPSTGTAWTVSNAYFKCDVASVGFYIMLF